MPSPSIVLLRTQTDTRLVALARDGHERAFEAIVERYRRQLLRACRRVLPEARAEDALQQTLMAAWRGLRRGDEVRELRPWLHRIAHNTSLNLLRQSGYDYEQIEESLQIADAPDDELQRRAVVRQTLQGLASLPPRQREALLAIAVEGRSQDEVAGELGLSTGAVRQLVHRARTTLRTAATAVAPLPLVTWLASGSRGELSSRIAELSAGAGGAGASAALAKAGTVVVLAGGAVAGPALVQKRTEGPQAPAAAISGPREDREAAHPPARRASASRRVTVSVPAVRTPEPAGGGSERRATTKAPARERDDDESGDDGRGGGTRSGPTTTDRDDDAGRDDRHEDRSGPSGGDEPDRSGPSGGGDDELEFEREDSSGPSLRTRSSGSGSGDDAEQHELAEPSPEPAEEPDGDSSGPGSGGEYESHDD
ncbi:MAG TPA: sigma-70 family RNA polymerase sigma factor [Solirubrobacteraceae bacterium]|nr:sigma-70 family RNA polymerase sigma factor [Solirubrobacteraceae bacterium]